MLPQPQGLIFQQYAKELPDSESAALHLEQKHVIQPRWTADSSEYQAAVLQRKCFHVHRLQHKIVTDVDWLRWSSLVVSRNPQRHRGTSTQLIGHVAYDFAGLQLEGLQQPCWKAPWPASGQFVSARDCEMQHLQQLKTRRDEELQILCREAEHMLEFYQKQSQTCMLLFWLSRVVCMKGHSQHAQNTSSPLSVQHSKTVSVSSLHKVSNTF